MRCGGGGIFRLAPLTGLFLTGLIPALAVEALVQEKVRAPLRAFWLALLPVGGVGPQAETDAEGKEETQSKPRSHFKPPYGILREHEPPALAVSECLPDAGPRCEKTSTSPHLEKETLPHFLARPLVRQRLRCFEP